MSSGSDVRYPRRMDGMASLFYVEVKLDICYFFTIGGAYKMKLVVYHFKLTWAERSSELFWSPVVCRLSVRPSVRLSVCPSVRLYTFRIFDFFSRTTGPILTKIGTNHPWVMGGLKFVQIKGPRPFLRGDNNGIAKIHFFLRTTGPISTKLGTKHPWVIRIQICMNEGPSLFPRGDLK